MLILLSIFNIYKIMEVEMDKLFKLKENNTSVRTEVVAGITTFMTMAYILAVNPSILSASGMDSNAILMATAIASAIGCFAMAFLANYPFALAPGLGLNAYFAYTVCGSMGYSWKVELFAVFVEGLVFIVLSLTNVREAIFNAIPTTLKKGVSVGIGLFVEFIGLHRGFKRRRVCKRHTSRKPGAYGACKAASGKCGRFGEAVTIVSYGK